MRYPLIQIWLVCKKKNHKETHMKYIGCTQCTTSKLSKKVLHLGDIVAQRGAAH